VKMADDGLLERATIGCFYMLSERGRNVLQRVRHHARMKSTKPARTMTASPVFSGARLKRDDGSAAPRKMLGRF
jgi:hypothetical protein